MGLVFSAFAQAGVTQTAQVFKKVEIFAICICAKVAHVGKQGVSGFLATEPVQGGIGQNSLKEHGQFGGRLVAVVRGQLDHAVLQDVERRLLIANVVKRALEGTFFGVLEEI